MDLANEAIQHHLRIVTDTVRHHLLGVQPSLVEGAVKEVPYIPPTPVADSATATKSFEEISEEQLSGPGVYDLVDFSNNDIGYHGVDQLLYGQSRIYLKGLDVYQGMLAKIRSSCI